MAADDTSSQTTVITHDALIRSPVNILFPTANQIMVQDFSDVIGVPPANLGQDYLTKCDRVAALLGLSAAPRAAIGVLTVPRSDVQIQPISIQRPVSMAAGMAFSGGSVVKPVSNLASQTDMGTHTAVSNASLSVRNSVFDFMNRTNVFIAQAANAGFQPPDNPFARVAQLDAARRNRMIQIGNAGSTIAVTPQEADDIIYNIGVYVKLVTASIQGKINLDRSTNVAAQFNSFTLSMDGYGSNGNVATDLMRFLPSADEVRAQKDADLLSAFDFSKRTPRVVFTADYQPADQFQGALVGFKKIPDASGYILKRLDIFDHTSKSIQLSNTDLASSMDHLRDYIKAYVLTFYDTLDDTQIWAYLDQTTSRDSYYYYTIQAYQVQNDAKDQLFNISTNPTSFSSANRNKLTTTLDQLAKQYFGPNASADDINPWPLVSLILYGNSQFDWILAAVNCRTSVNRNDVVTDTRRFSYLGARASHILEFMDRGLFVSPKNVNDMVDAVNSSVVNFGVSQTIAEILHETGVLYYFEGTDQKKPSGFQRAGTIVIGTSSLLSGIIAAVDPDTATMDLKSLGSNLPQILNNTQFSNDPTEVTGLKLGQTAAQSNVHGSAGEISIPDATSDTVAQADVQYLDQIPATQDGIIDLTTFDGLSALIRTIRLFADEGPNRGGSDETAIVFNAPLSPSPANAVFTPTPTIPTTSTGGSTISGIPVSLPTGGGVVRRAPPPPSDTSDDPIIIKKPGGGRFIP